MRFSVALTGRKASVTARWCERQNDQAFTISLCSLYWIQMQLVTISRYREVWSHQADELCLLVYLAK